MIVEVKEVEQRHIQKVKLDSIGWVVVGIVTKKSNLLRIWVGYGRLRLKSQIRISFEFDPHIKSI